MIHYYAIAGSIAYGCSTPNSDLDFRGFGDEEIVQVEENIDIRLWTTEDFLELCRRGYPATIESLFVPDSCVLIITDFGKRIRKRRHDFLSIPLADKFQMIAKTLRRKNDSRSNYHAQRLQLISEQILTIGTIDYGLICDKIERS